MHVHFSSHYPASQFSWLIPKKKVVLRKVEVVYDTAAGDTLYYTTRPFYYLSEWSAIGHTQGHTKAAAETAGDFSSSLCRASLTILLSRIDQVSNI